MADSVFHERCSGFSHRGFGRDGFNRGADRFATDLWRASFLGRTSATLRDQSACRSDAVYQFPLVETPRISRSSRRFLPESSRLE